MKKYLLVALPLLLTSFGFSQIFNATPLTDFQPSELYLQTYPGFLYEGSNTPPADHELDGRAAADRVKALDIHGRPFPAGKIVVIGIGMSNWTFELCDKKRSSTRCFVHSFLASSQRDAQVNHKDLVLVNCAKSGQSADKWLDDSYLNYTYCESQLQAAGVTDAQVQVVLYKDATEYPQQSLSPGYVCTPTSTVDACVYERYVGITARYVRGRYPNLQQMFLHSRIYAGYAAPDSLNPEPFAYEYGFSTKWLIEAQIQQIRTGVIDPTAGDLSYTAAPWIAWGPYFWASGTHHRNDGIVWLPSDYTRSDYTHPSDAGIAKVSQMMLDYYLTSPYTPWFPSH